MKKRNMKVVVKKVMDSLSGMGIVYQYVKGLNGSSYEIALSNLSDVKKLKNHFDNMWLPIRYKNDDVFFTIML